MMPDISKNTRHDTLQLNKKQKTGQEENEVSLVKHYPLILRGTAGPLMVMQTNILFRRNTWTSQVW